jgi:putative transposase
MHSIYQGMKQRRALVSPIGERAVADVQVFSRVEIVLPVQFLLPPRAQKRGDYHSFNRKFRDECLAIEWFRNRIGAKIVIDDWRRDYNEVRLHSSLYYDSPLAYRQWLESHSTPAVIARTEWS